MVMIFKILISGSGPSSPQSSARGGGGRGRGGRGRGRPRGKKNKEGDDEWSMQKYDFEAPDVKEKVESHKPNFVKTDGDDAEKEKKNTFKKVSRDEWNEMTREQKKKYLKDRKKWKLAQTVFIKDDSDNEQLTDDDDNNDEDEDLQYSGSEDEKEKQDRLAREALKSYSNAFQKDDAPEDYHLVMRKDVVEKELADDDETKYETVEDIERREKIEKMEMKEQEKKAKMREERLRRIQAFQAASMAREEPQEEEEVKTDDQVQFSVVTIMKRKRSIERLLKVTSCGIF